MPCLLLLRHEMPAWEPRSVTRVVSKTNGTQNEFFGWMLIAWFTLANNWSYAWKHILLSKFFQRNLSKIRRNRRLAFWQFLHTDSIFFPNQKHMSPFDLTWNIPCSMKAISIPAPIEIAAWSKANFRRIYSTFCAVSLPAWPNDEGLTIIHILISYYSQSKIYY